jgi:hypothetical protein
LARAAASSTRARGVAIRLEIKKIASFFFLFVKNLVIGAAFFFLLSLSFFGHAFYSRAATCTSSSDRSTHRGAVAAREQRRRPGRCRAS